MLRQNLMRAARLHGIKDLQLEELPIPRPGPGELLVRVEACGICPTDARKYATGVSDGKYPFNPGHEWVGVVEATGPETGGWAPGDRVYGDTYGGFAELALVPARPRGWSCGATRIDPAVPAERAVFLEPLADCLHAVHDQARLAAGQRALVVAAGAMGLKIVAEAARIGASVIVVEPIEIRRRFARDFGAAEAIGTEGWAEAV